MSEPMSQCQVIGLPRVRTWDDYEAGCKSTYGGGYRTAEEIEIFHHGIATIFNLLRAEFPSAQKCKAAPDLLQACENFLYGRKESRECEDEMRAAIRKATGGSHE